MYIFFIFLLFISNVVLMIFLIKARKKIIKLYSRYLICGYPKSWSIKRVGIDTVSPIFKKKTIRGPIETEIYFLAGGFYTAVSDRELWILSVLAKTSNNIFELGTYLGATTYMLAKNSPCDAKVVTLTLHPDQIHEVINQEKDIKIDINNALLESQNTLFLYEGTNVENKITQLYSDSKKFDESPYLESFDLIFIDGAHVYSYVMNDAEKALKMLKPGGYLFWHDYRGPNQTKGVFDALNELSKNMTLRHIKGTSLVYYQKPK